MNEFFARYEQELAIPRSTFINRVSSLSNEKDPRTLMMFWLNFSSFSVEMTKYVEDWIDRAGQKTKELGYEKLGVKLIKHAVHERNHHLMLINDTYKLTELWNQQYAPPNIESDKLIERKPMRSTLAYQKLHEDCIAGDSPFAQIAIEYEIEALSAGYGPIILKNAVESLGNQIRSSLTFAFDHTEIDVAHTEYNRGAIAEFLSEYPAATDKLIEVGSSVLEIYATFLNNCLEHTEVFEKSELLA